jgi:O-antigen ligase
MRAHIRTEGATFGTLINPITIGYYGATLALFCINAIICNLFSSRLIKILLYPLIGLGFIILLLGASRGPLLGFMIFLIVSLIAHFYRSEEKTLKLGKFVIIVLMSIFMLSGTVSHLTKKYDIFLFYRVEKFFTDRDKGRKEVRDFSFEGAWNDFLSSPIVGKQFVGTYDNFYPHNIFLEVLMATGLLGGIYFLIYFYQFSLSSFRLISQKRFQLYTPLVFTSLICFFLSITSGSIFASPEIWILMTLTTLLVKV